MKHKKKHQNRYIWKVKNNDLSGTKRPKWRTEKFEILQDLCENYDKFSGPERKQNLIEYLGKFSRRDAIPEKYYETPETDDETDDETLESDSE